MKEFSEKEIERLYKEAKLTEIPDLWKNIEGNLAQKNSSDDLKDGKRKKGPGKAASFRWISGMAAAAAVALLAIPGWKLLSGNSKSYDGNSQIMENKGIIEEMNGFADSMMSADHANSDGSMPREEAVEEVSPDIQGYEETEPLLKDGETNEFWLKVELKVEQVQTTLDGYLVTGEIQTAERNWFEVGERVTLFYEGADYEEEEFSGILHVMLDVEEENLKILEILP